MASMFTHAFVALTGAAALEPRGARKRLLILSAAASILPDADVIGFRFGVQYGDLLGHRGLSHSLLFAALLALAIALAAFPAERRFSASWWRLWAWFAFITASHGVLDALTNGGLGIAFFSPFDETRHFLPWQPILVSPIGIAEFFDAYGLRVIRSEVLVVWLPWAAAVLLVVAARKRCRARSGPPTIRTREP